MSTLYTICIVFTQQLHLNLIQFNQILQTLITIRQMEKYRRWTDNATGVNPFIIADSNKHNLLYNILTIIKSIVLVVPFLFYLQTLLICQLFPIVQLKMMSASIVLYFLMIFQTDDNNFVNNLNKFNKSKSKVKFILSNFSSPLNVFYYLSKVPNCVFVIFHQYEEQKQIIGQKYETVSGVKLLLRVFFKRQPFYELHNVSERKSTKYYNSLKDLTLLNQGQQFIVFYEKIMTNGLGTIKLNKSLAQKIYQLEADYLMCRISHTTRDQLYFNMVRSPIVNWFRMLGGYKTQSLKVRGQITDITNIHSINELLKDINEFTTNNSSKLLQTKPADYLQFLDFYGKTQKSQYVNDFK